MVIVSFLLGPKRRGHIGAGPFESGIAPTGSTRIRFSAGFYLVALSFLIFDLEAAFIFAWAASARQTGWSGYGGLVFFVVTLAVLLAYEWKRGLLDWGPRRRGREERRNV